MDNIPSFCNRKHGREKIDYIHPLLEKRFKRNLWNYCLSRTSNANSSSFIKLFTW